MQYKIVTGQAEEVEAEVGTLLAKGWRLESFGVGIGGSCMQTMTRPTPKKRKPSKPAQHPLTLWLNKNCPRVQRMREPITDEIAEEIERRSTSGLWNRETVKDVFIAMDNWKELHDKRVSAYKTLITWMNKRSKL